MTTAQKPQIAQIVSLAEKFLDHSGSTAPVGFIKPALKAGLTTKGGIAKVLGVNEEQVMRVVGRSGNRDLKPVAQIIIKAGQQRLRA